MIAPKSTKENALKLISYYYDLVCDEKSPYPTKTYFNNEFYCYEYIAKGYAMLYITKDKRFNANQKKEMFKIIRDL